MNIRFWLHPDFYCSDENLVDGLQKKSLYSSDFNFKLSLEAVTLKINKNIIKQTDKSYYILLICTMINDNLL